MLAGHNRPHCCIACRARQSPLHRRRRDTGCQPPLHWPFHPAPFSGPIDPVMRRHPPVIRPCPSVTTRPAYLRLVPHAILCSPLHSVGRISEPYSVGMQCAEYRSRNQTVPLPMSRRLKVSHLPPARPDPASRSTQWGVSLNRSPYGCVSNAWMRIQRADPWIPCIPQSDEITRYHNNSISLPPPPGGPPTSG